MLKQRNIFVLTLLSVCALAGQSFAVDGIAVSYHSLATDVSGLHCGTLVRHIIRADTTAGDSAIYAAENVRQARLSPDGTRVAFIRHADGALCVTRIIGGDVGALAVVSPDACIDWADSVWIYYTFLYNHVTLKRIHTRTFVTEDVGWFPMGAVQFSVSAIRDCLRGDIRPEDSLWGDAVRGAAVMDYGGGEYKITTFDYRVFQIATAAGCLAHMSPSGMYYSTGACEDDTANYHRKLSIFAWDGSAAGEIVAPAGECMSRGSWAVNTDAWLVSTVGRDRELLLYHDMALFSRDSMSIVRVTRNDTGAYDEGCDFWEGNPDSAMSRSALVNAGVRRSTPRVFLSGGRYPHEITGAASLYNVQGVKIHARRHGAVPSGVYIAESNGMISAHYSILHYGRK